MYEESDDDGRVEYVPDNEALDFEGARANDTALSRDLEESSWMDGIIDD